MLRRLLLIKRCFDHLDQSGFFADPDSGFTFRGIVKLVQLLVAPLGFDVSRREHGDHHLGIFELVDDLVVVHIVAGQFFVAPNLSRLAHELAQLDLQHAVKLGDPAFLILVKSLIIHVSITDENIVHGQYLSVV